MNHACPICRHEGTIFIDMRNEVLQKEKQFDHKILEDAIMDSQTYETTNRVRAQEKKNEALKVSIYNKEVSEEKKRKVSDLPPVGELFPNRHVPDFKTSNVLYGIDLRQQVSVLY